MVVLMDMKGCKAVIYVADITDEASISIVVKQINQECRPVYGWLNNVANNPKMEGKATNMEAIQFENYPLSI